MRLPSSGSNKPLNWIKKAKIAPRFTANLIFRLFRFPSAHAYWPSYLDMCGDTAWYCCVHPGECFLLHSFVVHCACVQKSECVCLCVCLCVCVCVCVCVQVWRRPQLHRWTVQRKLPLRLIWHSISSHLSKASAHTSAHTPTAHTHLRTATGTVSNTQTLALIGQKLVAAKNVLSKFRALVFFYLTLLFWWGWLDFVSSL